MGEVTSMWVKTTSNIYREVGRYFWNNRRLHQGARAETANVVMSGDGGVTTCRLGFTINSSTPDRGFLVNLDRIVVFLLIIKY